tara:strand:+ start:37 stop:228 length:192 start_codon:yes stop_codon:yes gene_type:complete
MVYQSYKKGQEVYILGAYGEKKELLGLVSRQTKYSFFYIDDRGRERMKYRKQIISKEEIIKRT